MTTSGPTDATPPADPTVRVATEGDATAARSVLDAAMLEIDGFDERLAADDVLVAAVDDRVVGAAVLRPHFVHSGVHVEAVAVRPRRRGQGIGAALIDHAATRGPLTAEFDADVRPFYESLGFSVRALDDDRYRGVLTDVDR